MTKISKTKHITKNGIVKKNPITHTHHTKLGNHDLEVINESLVSLTSFGSLNSIRNKNDAANAITDMQRAYWDGTALNSKDIEKIIPIIATKFGFKADVNGIYMMN